MQHVPIALPQVLVTRIHVPIVVVDIWVHIVAVWIHVVTIRVHIVTIATGVHIPTIWVQIIVLIHVISTGILVFEAIVVLLSRNNHSVRISLFSWQDYPCFSRESLTLPLALTLMLLIVETTNKQNDEDIRYIFNSSLPVINVICSYVGPIVIIVVVLTAW